MRMTRTLRAPAKVDVRDIDPRSTPAMPRGGKNAAAKALQDLEPRLAALQEKLYAHGQTGGTRKVLLVLQGLDTSGKSGTIKHVIGQIDPQGAHIHAFKAPTPEERKHDFLWRINRALPGPGMIGVFDRSHYEDVLVVRVRNLAPRATWSRRYATIDRFEQQLTANGTVVIKCFLHISFEEWRERQLARLDDKTKHWKYNPNDLEDGALWEDYLDAYNDALRRCRKGAPWYVIPADRKWHRNLAVTGLLVEHLENMKLTWPKGDFDVAGEKKRLRGVGQD
jgi:PPK2 family polyphosphate:nucleotide phosphotransferase